VLANNKKKRRRVANSTRMQLKRIESILGNNKKQRVLSQTALFFPSEENTRKHKQKPLEHKMVVASGYTKSKRPSQSVKSPRAHKSLNKKQKITDVERRRLRRLPKPDLQKILKLAGEPTNQAVPLDQRTKNYLAHAISRNPRVAAFFAAGGFLLGSAGSASLMHFLKTTKASTQELTGKKWPAYLYAFDEDFEDNGIDTNPYAELEM
jgi:hypothetical protein